MKTKQRYLAAGTAALAAVCMLGAGIAYAAVPATQASAAGASVMSDVHAVYEADAGSNHRVYAGEPALNLFAAAADGAQAEFSFTAADVSGKYIGIRLQNLTIGRTIGVVATLSSGETDHALSDSFTYYVDGQETSAAGGAMQLTSGGDYEGYYGTLTIPGSAFTGAGTADAVTLTFTDAAASYLRINVFEIALYDSLSDDAPEALWTPSNGGYTAAPSTQSSQMDANEFYIYSGASAGYGNTYNYVSFPESVLTQEGYIDTSVYKGIIVTVDLTDTQGDSGYFYDAMNVYLSTAPSTGVAMKAQLAHIRPNSESPYDHSSNCAITRNFVGDVYMSFADCGVESGALIMPYISFNSAHKALEGKSYTMTYRLVTQTVDELYTASADTQLQHAEVSFSKLRYASAEEISFTVTPANGYALQSVFVNDVAVQAQDGTYFWSGDANCVVSATVAPIEYDINLYGADGTLLTGEEYDLTYTIESGAVLPILPATSTQVFLGWFDGQGSDAAQVTQISAGTYGDIALYARFTSENIVTVSLTQGEGGSVATDRLAAVAGDEVTLTVDADYGWRLLSATLNGTDITAELADGSYTVEAAEGQNLAFAVSFEQIETFAHAGGDAFFAYDSFNDSQGFMGAVFAQFDAVNVRGRAKSSDASLYAGIRAAAQGTLAEGDTISVLYNQLVLGADLGLRIGLVSGGNVTYVADGASYTVVHADGSRESLQAEGGIVLTGADAQEAFCGYLLLPASAFAGVTSFDGIILASPMTDYVRHNFGDIAILSSAGVSQTVWTGGGDFEAWQSSGTADGTLFEAAAMSAGEVAIVEASRGASTTWGYEQYGFLLPDEMVDDDGFADLAALGVTGMLITVSNPSDMYLNYQIGIIDAKYDDVQGQMSNSVAAYRWITASSTRTVYCYADGEMVQGGATIIPAGFEGAIYVPFSEAAFIKGNSLAETDAFPTEILPYIYGGFSTSDAGSRVIVESIEFVTDDSMYTPYAIGIFDSNGGTVTSNYESVGYGTEVTITVNPDAGYRVKYADLYMGDAPAQSMQLSEEGTFTFVVTGTVMVDVTFETIGYTITYVLPDGATHDNPETYTVLQSVVLTDPVLEGYVFEGWYLTQDYTGDPLTSFARGTTGNMTLYAKFTPEESDVNVGLIVGCSIAGVVVVAAAVAIPLILKKRRKGQ